MNEAVLKRAARHIRGDVARHAAAHEFIAKHIPDEPAEIRDSLARYLRQPLPGITIIIPAEVKEARRAISKKISAVQKLNESIPFVEAVLRWWNDTPAYRSLIPAFFTAIKFTTDLAPEDIEPAIPPTKFLRRHNGDVYLSPEPQSPPFDLETLILSASLSLTFLAQNQWHLTGRFGKGQDHWPHIEQALLKGVVIEIAAMGAGFGDPKNLSHAKHQAIETWKGYQKSTEFDQHLKHCWTILRQWSERAVALANSLPQNSNLHIVSVDFCPYSLTVVDREDGDGIMVLSPRTGESNPVHRPEFIFRKASNRAAFNSYYDHIEEIFTQQTGARTEFRLRGP